MQSIYWSMSSFPRTVPWRKQALCLNRHQLPIVPQLRHYWIAGVGFPDHLTHPWWYFVCLDFVQACARSHICCQLYVQLPRCVKKMLGFVSHPLPLASAPTRLRLLEFFWVIFHLDPWALLRRRECHMNVPFRADWSTVSHSLHPLLSLEGSLMRPESFTYLWL